jgi:5-methylcytosine-specific restriction endonuclease McrA
MAAKNGDPRKTHRYQQQRRRYLELNTTCYICGTPLDYDANPRSRWAPSIDHTLAITNGGDPYNEHNWQPAHYGCNSSKGARPPKPSPRSRRW